RIATGPGQYPRRVFRPHLNLDDRWRDPLDQVGKVCNRSPSRLARLRRGKLRHRRGGYLRCLEPAERGPARRRQRQGAEADAGNKSACCSNDYTTSSHLTLFSASIGEALRTVSVHQERLLHESGLSSTLTSRRNLLSPRKYGLLLGMQPVRHAANAVSAGAETAETFALARAGFGSKPPLGSGAKRRRQIAVG